ncbi:MAG: response regulator [Gemmataceae bacterium]|nr:response regulator [Gemmataceae bacterium]
MQHAQILSVGVDGRLEGLLEELATSQGFWLRSVRQPNTCLGLLRKGSAGVVIVKLGRQLEQELSLITDIRRGFPETAVVALGASENAALAALCWDLGASYVLFPPMPIEKIREVILALMTPL